MFRISLLVALIAPLASCEDLFGVPPAEEVQPNAPSRFTMVDYTDGILTLRWEDESNVELGYAIESSESIEGDKFTRLASLPADSEEFQVRVEKPARFRVFAYSRAAQSDSLSVCLYYLDQDEDGAGGRMIASEGPCPKEHSSLNGGDCDDEGVSKGSLNYRDADGDGHGDPADFVTDCVLSPGYVTLGDDCDDRDRGIFPSGLNSGCLGIVSAKLPTERRKVGCVFGGNGRIYCFGGHDPSNDLSDVLEYDPAADVIAKKSARLPNPAASLTCIEGEDGPTVYCLGWPDNFKYDPRTDSITIVGSDLPSKVKGLQGAHTTIEWQTSCAYAADHRLFCLGGYAIGHGFDNVFEYSVTEATLIWKKALLPRPRWATSCAAHLNGKIYCFGGEEGYLREQDDILEYDPRTDRLVVLETRMPQPMMDTSCVAHPNLRIYCFGGANKGFATKNIIAFLPPASRI